MSKKHSHFAQNGLFLVLFVLTCLFISLPSASKAASGRPNSILIIDGSRSMWGQIDKTTKVDIMRNALTDNFLRYNSRINLGMVAYGHRKADNCEDIAQIRPIKRLDGPAYVEAISNFKPKGSTPIAKALEFAAKKLKNYRNPKSIILLSDGLDNCQGAPCQTARAIKARDPYLKIHVIAFDKKLRNQLTALRCVAKNTGGQFASASNEAQLKRALSNVIDSSLLITSSNKSTINNIPQKGWQTTQNTTQNKVQERQKPLPNYNELLPPEDLSTQSAKPAKPNIKQEAPKLPEAPKGLVSVSFLALIKEGGLPIKANIVWRIFEAKPNKKGKYQLLSTHRKARPTAALTPGQYLVNAAYGRSHLTKKITLRPNEPKNEIFVLNAGGLRLASVLANGKSVPKNTVRYAIYTDERDQFGNRQKVINNAKPGLIIRLNAGIYHIVSQYGDANAKVNADVTIEPGKLTEATVNHTAAKVTFKLVVQPGGEALADTRWSILTPQGEVVKDSAGALPTHILAAGNYVILARRAGQVFKREFQVKPGETKQIEVVVQ